MLNVGPIFFAVVNWTTYLAPASTIVGILGGLYTLWRKVRQPGERLEVSAIQHSFGLPTRLHEAFSGFRNRAIEELQQENAGSSGNIIPLSYTFTEEWMNGCLSNIDLCSTYWIIKIDNVGRKKAVGVAVSIPGRVRAALTERGAKIEQVTDVEGAIKIGEISAKDSIRIQAWTSTWTDSYANLRVTHDMGIAKVKGLYPTTEHVIKVYAGVSSLFRILIFSACIYLIVRLLLPLFSAFQAVHH